MEIGQSDHNLIFWTKKKTQQTHDSVNIQIYHLCLIVQYLFLFIV